jgi:hypothetical protein
MASPFRLHPIPNREVIDLLERTLAAARRGEVPCIGIVAVNPVNETESLFAGDLSQIRATVLLGGLVRAKTELANKK